MGIQRMAQSWASKGGIKDKTVESCSIQRVISVLKGLGLGVLTDDKATRRKAGCLMSQLETLVSRETPGGSVKNR